MADTSGWTLDEALKLGQGTERPFRCSVHEDRTASASVNVLKGVWFCHACHASGRVDNKKAPKADDLLAMLSPEEACRVYPNAWLETFTQPGPIYWGTRFAPWVVHALGMGEDPFTGDGTFPVHTPAGQLAGVGRRHITEDKKSRYLYPRNWSASMTLFGTAGRYPGLPVLTVVEGAADTAAVREVGAPAVGCYGSGLHQPQVELIARYNPKLILLGFDMDDAGEKAVTRAFKQIGRIAPMKRVYWPAKDPADTPRPARKEALLKAVRASQYGSNIAPDWDRAVSQGKREYERFLEEAA